LQKKKHENIVNIIKTQKGVEPEVDGSETSKMIEKIEDAMSEKSAE
jgi:hypothetical protein